MAKFLRDHPKRFAATGLSFSHDVDALPVDKFPFLQNVRSYILGILEPRHGITQINSTALDQLNVHSGKRLVNDLPGASPPWVRVIGAGTKLYSGQTSFTERDTGYSGDPLSMIRYRPPRSPEAHLYIADANKMRKIRVDGTDSQMGIAPPNVAPTAVIGTPSYNIIEEFDSVGTLTNAGTAGALSSAARITTTINRILYDVGTIGWASIEPVSLAEFRLGARVRVNSGGGTDETVTVQTIQKKIADTTIESIDYDSGSSGPCTIQPTIPTFDLVPDILVLLGGTEAVRVLSVARGPGGSRSFRCSTVATFAASAAIAGLDSFRVFLANNHVATETLTDNYVESTLTVGTGTISDVSVLDLSKISARPTQDGDEVHLSLFIDDLNKFTEGKIQFDVDESTNDFTRNLFTFTFRANDLTPAIAGTLTQLTALQRALQREQIDEFGREEPDPVLTGDFLGPFLRGHPRGLGRHRQDEPSPFHEHDPFIDPVLMPFPVDDPGGQPTGTQTSTGESQWFELRVRVSRLSRVGSDTSRSLKDVQAIRVSLTVTDTVVARVNAWWLGGSFGPDIGDIGMPLLYRYRGRSTVTGAKSNAGPPMRAGIAAQRQSVVVSMTQHSDSQVDVLDVYRFGGVLLGWTYIGTAENSATPSFTDEFSQLEIANSDRLEFDNFQPFSTIDSPKEGTVDVVGTSVTHVSGDLFNVEWARGSIITIDGVPHLLYNQPTSTTRLELIETAGTKTAVKFRLEQPTLLGQPMPVMWGPLAGETAGFLFACGDDQQPGIVFITKGNQPDSAPETFQVELTSPSEPLMNGVVYDGRSYVFSSERLFALYPSFGAANVFTPREVPNGKGLFSRWMLAVGPSMWFGSKDGIYEIGSGGLRSITDQDLYEFFPGEGRSPRSVTIAGVTIPPPDFSQTSDLRLSYYDNYLYFDFVDTSANRRTLVYDIRTRGWFYDTYTPGVVTHFGEEGLGINSLLLGADDGKVYQASGVNDNGTAIAGRIITPSLPLGDQRSQKIIGDIMVEMNSGGEDITIAPWKNSFTSAIGSPQVKSTASRLQTILDLSSGSGELAEEIGLNISWSLTTAPKFYEWGPSYVPKPEDTFLRGTDWDDLNHLGAKFVQGVVIEADTGGAARTIEVQHDGGTVGATLTLNSNGQLEVPFGFTPFVAHNLRLVPTDANSWRLFKYRFVWEPMPELTTVWETQATTHDLPGFQHLRDGYISLISTDIVTLTITVDGVAFTYTVPSTAGAHGKPYLVFQRMKGKEFVYRLSSPAGFRLFVLDSEVRVRAWGSESGYTVQRPFGDAHREFGARI